MKVDLTEDERDALVSLLSQLLDVPAEHNSCPTTKRQVQFDRWWVGYPRKESKKNAWRAWSKLKPSDELVEQMIEAVRLQRRSRKWLDGFTPLPTTWLNGGCWEDQLPLAEGQIDSEPGDREEVADLLGGAL